MPSFSMFWMSLMTKMRLQGWREAQWRTRRSLLGTSRNRSVWTKRSDNTNPYFIIYRWNWLHLSWYIDLKKIIFLDLAEGMLMILNSFLRLCEFFIHSNVVWNLCSPRSTVDKARRERHPVVLILSRVLSFLSSTFATFIEQYSELLHFPSVQFITSFQQKQRLQLLVIFI